MKKIVFYDGDCGFCNKTVQFILKYEKSKSIYFSALQSEFAKDFFTTHKMPVIDFSTFYYWNGNKLFEKSTGALELTKELKFPIKLLIIFQLMPKFMRDFCYDFIAKRRKRLVQSYCYIPTKETSLRFLS